MKTQNKVKKWKLLIITVWILFLVAASIGCISLQRSTVLQKVRTELTNQSEIISGEFNSLVETNFYSRTALVVVRYGTVRGLLISSSSICRRMSL